jgi:antitoxin component of MazEF toxin-antitoxin module
MLETKIEIWDGSCAVRIPKVAAKSLGLTDGKFVSLEVFDGGLIIRPSKQKFDLAYLVSQAIRINAQNPVDEIATGGESL